MNINAIKSGENIPEDVNVIIEVPIGGEPIKYEMDKASGALFVDRFLPNPGATPRPQGIS
jgi:inorganic pyrophosphatase